MFLRIYHSRPCFSVNFLGWSIFLRIYGSRLIFGMKRFSLSSNRNALWFHTCPPVVLTVQVLGRGVAQTIPCAARVMNERFVSSSTHGGSCLRLAVTYRWREANGSFGACVIGGPEHHLIGHDQDVLEDVR